MAEQTNMSDLDLLQELDGSRAPDTPSTGRGLSIGAVVLLIGVALTVLVFGIALVRQQQGQPTQGPAPDFSLTTFDGQTFRLADYRGKVVVINFWASWCGPCRDEAPLFERLWQQFKDKGVVFLGITYADDPKDSAAFMDEFNVTYPVADDGRSEVSKALYHIQGVPETFIIDQDGNIQRFFYSIAADPTPVPGSLSTPASAPDDLVVTESELAAEIERLLTQS